MVGPLIQRRNGVLPLSSSQQEYFYNSTTIQGGGGGKGINHSSVAVFHDRPPSEGHVHRMKAAYRDFRSEIRPTPPCTHITSHQHGTPTRTVASKEEEFVPVPTYGNSPMARKVGERKVGEQRMPDVVRVTAQTKMPGAVSLRQLDGQSTREVQDGGIVVERKTKVLWDKRHIISKDQLTREHTVTGMDVRESEITRSKRVLVESYFERHMPAPSGRPAAAS